MHREGHIGAALIGYAPLAFVATVLGFAEVAILGGVVAVGVAMVPDYDQRVPGLKHRGVTHTVWFALVVGVVFAVLGVLASTGGVLEAVGLGVFGFALGAVTIVSHVAADALTPMGVQPLAPLDERHVSYDVARAKNPVANYALLAAGIVAVGVAVVAGGTVTG